MKENKETKTDTSNALLDEVTAIAKEILTNRGYDESIMEEPYLKESLQKLCEEKGEKQISKKDIDNCINVYFFYVRYNGRIDLRPYRKADKEHKTEMEENESTANSSSTKKKHNALILLSIIIISFILMLLCLSCQPRNPAKETASHFLNIVCGKDTGDYTRIYPHAKDLRYLLHLEQYRIQNSVCIDSDKVKIRVLGECMEDEEWRRKNYKCMRKDRKRRQKDITLFLKPKNHKDLSQGYLIYDSKGLVDINKNDSVYTYAYWNGYIQDESTDQEVARAMKICKFHVLIHNMTKGLDHKKKEEKE